MPFNIKLESTDVMQKRLRAAMVPLDVALIDVDNLSSLKLLDKHAFNIVSNFTVYIFEAQSDDKPVDDPGFYRVIGALTRQPLINDAAAKLACGRAIAETVAACRVLCEKDSKRFTFMPDHTIAVEVMPFFGSAFVFGKLVEYTRGDACPCCGKMHPDNSSTEDDDDFTLHVSDYT